MALTPRRWLAALLVVMVASLAAVLPPGSARGFVRYLPWGWYNLVRNEPDSLVTRHNQLLGQATFAGEQLVLATVRDSVLAQSTLIRRARLGGPQFYRLRVGGTLPRQPGAASPAGLGSEPAMLRRIQIALDSSWRELPRRDPSAWTLVALADAPLRLVADGHEATLGLPQGGEMILYGATVGGGCALLLDANRAPTPVTPELVLDRLAPCRWQAAFGTPSDSIATWLARQSWITAYPVRFWLSRWGELEVIARRRTQVLADTGAWGDSTSALVEWATWWGAVDAAGCYRGRTDSCLRVFRSPERWGWQARTAAAEAPLPAIRGRRVAGGLLLAGLLDDVLAAVGPERFHAFWTSDLAPDSALAVALQQPLEPWLMARVERRLGGFRSPPKLPLGTAAMSLVLTGLFVGAAVLGNSRRRMS